MALLEAKAKRLLAPKVKIETSMDYQREIQTHKKRYWELVLKIQIKEQFLNRLTAIIQKKQESRFGRVMTTNEQFAFMNRIGSVSKAATSERPSVLDHENEPTGDAGYASNRFVQITPNNNAPKITFFNMANTPGGNDLTNGSSSEKQLHKKRLDRLLKDFSSMSNRLKLLNEEKKMIKLKLRKICRELLMDDDVLYGQVLGPNEVILQLWEIDDVVRPSMFSPVYDEDSKLYFLRMAALEQQGHFISNSDKFCSTYIIEPLGDLSEKLDSIIDFGSGVEYESFELLKLAFNDFFHKSNKSDVFTSEKESIDRYFTGTHDKTMHIWVRV